jgi:dTDP-4-amino-4,6-dideoxygalactose transaminase
MEIPATQTRRRNDFLVFGAPDIREEEIQEVVATLRSGWIGTGPRCRRFEKLFREYIGCRHAVAVNSCTAGLELALEVVGVGAGDEVITTPLTFCATANAIIHRGAVPIFVDVDPSTGNILPEAVERAVTPKTKAVVPVHLYGYPCDMGALMDIAGRHGLFVIEDAAHALESKYRGRKIGDIGHLTVFSFYATKNITTGEGGMVTTNNDDWAREIEIRRLHGLDRDAWRRYSAAGSQFYDVVAPGYKSNMIDLQAALGIHQLARVEEGLKSREDYWRAYDEGLSNIDAISTLAAWSTRDIARGTRHGRHLYTVLVDEDAAGISRWEFVEALKRENIGTGVHFLALHLHSYYAHRYGYREGDFPNAESIAARIVSLPLSPALTEEDVTDVIGAIKTVLHAARHHDRSLAALAAAVQQRGCETDTLPAPITAHRNTA